MNKKTLIFTNCTHGWLLVKDDFGDTFCGICGDIVGCEFFEEEK